MEVLETVKQIKRSFRLFMNGTASRSMREKGLEYKINWGVSQVDLRRMALQYEKNVDLANALWKESIRECKILATLLMPSELMDMDMAKEWVKNIFSVEIAETIALNLFQYIEDANGLARWMLEDTDVLSHICAYNLICHLIKRDGEVDHGTISMLMNEARIDIHSKDRQLLHALVNCLDKVSLYSCENTEKATEILNEAGFGAF